MIAATIAVIAAMAIVTGPPAIDTSADPNPFNPPPALIAFAARVANIPFPFSNIPKNEVILEHSRNKGPRDLPRPTYAGENEES